MYLIKISNKISGLSVSFFHNLNHTTVCASLYMQPFWHNKDLRILTTTSVSQVPIDTRVGKNNLNACLTQKQLYFRITM